MPCYITYRAYTTIKDQDYVSFIGAVKALGFQSKTYGSVIDLDGGRAQLKQVTGGYELSGDRSLSNKLMQEHNLRKIEKEARKKGQRTKRQTDKNGNPQLVVVS